MRTGKFPQQSSAIMNSGVWQLIEKKSITSAVTTTTFSNLNGDTDIEYKLLSRFYCAATGNYQLRFNNDSGANYGYQYLDASNATLTAGRISGITATNPIGRGDSIGDVSQSEVLIYAKSGYVRTMLTNVVRSVSGTTINYQDTMECSWSNTADNLTSMVVLADGVNGIGIGTELELYARRSTL